MKLWVVYFPESYMVVRSEPTPDEYPGAGFAEGPFERLSDVHDRLCWLNRKVQ